MSPLVDAGAADPVVDVAEKNLAETTAPPPPPMISDDEALNPTKERVDFTSILPLDLIARILCALPGRRHVLNSSQVCRRFRQACLQRNVWGRWIRANTWSVVPREKMLVVFFPESSAPSLCPFSHEVPSVCPPDNPYLTWLFRSSLMSLESLSALLISKSLSDVPDLPFAPNASASLCIVLPASACLSKTVLRSSLLPYVLITSPNPPARFSVARTPFMVEKSSTSFGKTSVCHLRNIHCVVEEGANQSFGIVASGQGVKLKLENVKVSGAPYSGVLVDQFALLEATHTTVEKCGQCGFYLLQCPSGKIENCTVRLCNATGVSVHMKRALESEIDIVGNVIEQSKSTNGITIRPTDNACKVRMNVERNQILKCCEGIRIFTSSSSKKKKEALKCPHDPSCGGTQIVIKDNVVTSPASNGITVQGPCLLSLTKTVCIIQGNTVSHSKAPGIMINRPDSRDSGVQLVDNILIDTGETRPEFPGLRKCIEDKRCTRNVSGKSPVMQEFFRCGQCNLGQHGGVCSSCALVCHAGHKGLYVYAKCIAYCDCPENKDQRCSTFDCDP